jgi:hypothetical protein
MDEGTKESISYLHVELHLVLHGQLFNVHLIKLPMNKSHTRDNKFFDVTFSNWKKK